MYSVYLYIYTYGCSEADIVIQAVFKVTRQPHIFSREFRFKFDLSASKKLGFITPHELDANDIHRLPPQLRRDIDRDGTCVYLPLEDEDTVRVGSGDGQLGSTVLKRVCTGMFAELDPLVLLLLNRLQRLEVSLNA